jgi:hypothetical protein
MCNGFQVVVYLGYVPAYYEASEWMIVFSYECCATKEGFPSAPCHFWVL